MAHTDLEENLSFVPCFQPSVMTDLHNLTHLESTGTRTHMHIPLHTHMNKILIYLL